MLKADMNLYSFYSWAMGLVITLSVALGAVLVRMWGKQGIFEKVQESQQKILDGQSELIKTQAGESYSQGKELVLIREKVDHLTQTQSQHTIELSDIKRDIGKLLIWSAEARGAETEKARHGHTST
jgi:hypothetical protein